MAIKRDGLVEKRNILNEVRKNNMSLQELRFFSIYLSKINARDQSTRRVRFPLKDFQKIMEFGRLNTTQLKATTDSLLGKVISIPTERGGYTSFQLFKRCTVDKDDLEQWYVEIDAHDDALPLMFDFKKEYFTYELWNALRLRSGNQLRMYELLKQYEKIGELKMPLKKLRDGLGIAEDEYPRWDRFKDRVIDSCQQALEESTDIKFTYKPIKAGRKVTGIHFFIEKNTGYVDQLTLDEFVEMQEENEIVVETEFEEVSDPNADSEYEKRANLCSGLEHEIFNEFTFEQLEELVSLAWNKVDEEQIAKYLEDVDGRLAREIAVSEYIRGKILYANLQIIKTSRFAFIRAAVKHNYK